jgi:hypothetical protein
MIRKLILFLFLLMPIFALAQANAPTPQIPKFPPVHRKIIDKRFGAAIAILAGGLTLDGYSTVDGWSHGCYEGNSPSVTKGRVETQLVIEFVGFSIATALLKRAADGKEQGWAWWIPSVMPAGMHSAAGAHNIYIGCG